MQRRYGAGVVIAGLAAATGFGACLMASDEEPLPSSGPTTLPSGGSGGSGIIGPGGAPPGGVGAGPSHSLEEELDGAGGGANLDEPIPSDCQQLAEEPVSNLTLYLSARDTNSMASPALAREQLRASTIPTHIRPREFLNYYRITYPGQAPDPEVGLALFAHGAARTEQGQYDLQIGVRSFDAFSPQRAMNLTFVLDNSGSMQGGAMERQHAVITSLAARLQPLDVVSIVTWDTSDAVVLGGHQFTGPNDTTVEDAAGALAADGGTDLYGGLVAGYALAEQHYKTDGLNRVILISDGETNIGVTEETLIADLATEGEDQGIHLIGVGTGPAEGYDDQLMRSVITQARGSYVYLDTVDEASRMFSERFDEVMEVAARSVQITLTLPWYFEANEQSGEELSEASIDRESADLAPGDTLLFEQIISACHPDVLARDESINIRVDWIDPLVGSRHDDIDVRLLSDVLTQDQAPLLKARAVAAYAAGLDMGTPDALQDALHVVETARQGADDDELDEIADLIRLHPAFPQ